MNSQKIKKIASITGLFLGAFALSAVASNWGPAGCAAPGCNTGAPINVTITPQHKEGPLAVGKTSDPTTGFDLDVVGVGFFGGVKVGGALEVIGLTKLKTLQIGDATPSGDKQVGYVLSKKDENGTVEWKNSSSLANGGSFDTVSRIYCAVGNSGGNSANFLPPTNYTTFGNNIRREGGVNNGLLLGSSESSFESRITTAGGIKTATCPTGKKLLFHAVESWGKTEQDFNDKQLATGAVSGNYSTNTITCTAWSDDQPSFVAGIGLCI